MTIKLIASGPVIIENGKLLVTKDNKDYFYKIPGGRIEKGETLEKTCRREFEEETGLSCRIVKKLSTMKMNQNPRTGQRMDIRLHHYLCKLTSPVKNYKSFEHNGHKVRWLEIDNIKKKKHHVAPNIYFLIEKGDIK